MTEVTRVAVIDNSPYARRLLGSVLSSESDINVVYSSPKKLSLLSALGSCSPDVIIMTIDPSDELGLLILDHIMHDCPTPVITICSIKKEGKAAAFNSLQMGAVDFIQWNRESSATLGHLECEMREKVRTAAKIRVIRSLRLRGHHVQTSPVLGTGKAGREEGRCDAAAVDTLEYVMVVGASTGGPAALRALLGLLPKSFPAAIVIVQHMPEGFTTTLADQLDCHTSLRVREAVNGSQLKAGQALVAPGDWHLRIGDDRRVRLTKEPAVRGHRPSIDVTMQSVASICGARSCGVILTGMGSDGAQGLIAIHARGGKTFAQDGSSCVVDGMPSQARATGIVDYVDTPAEIARHLIAARQ